MFLTFAEHVVTNPNVCLTRAVCCCWDGYVVQFE